MLDSNISPKIWLPVLIVLVAAVGYLTWTESLQEQNSPSAPSLTKEGVGGVPGDWKTSRNEEYGFEVKYPRELIVDADMPYLTNLQGEESINFGLGRVSSESPVNPVEISFTILEEYKDLDTLMENKVSFDKILLQNKNHYKFLGERLVDNEAAYRFESFADAPGGPIKTGEHLVLKHNNLIFVMQFNLYPNNYLAHMDQILSTFKFIETASQSKTSNPPSLAPAPPAKLSGIKGTVIGYGCRGVPPPEPPPPGYQACSEAPLASFVLRIKNDATGVEKQAISDAVGKFQAELSPGKYTITEATGNLNFVGGPFSVTVVSGIFAETEFRFQVLYP